MLSQRQAPLVAALQQCGQRPNVAFYTPGHKRGQGISALHRAVLGGEVFRVDLPELPELDNLFAPAAVIAQAQSLAAEAFGAERTYFLANGSTCGIEAAILATCGPGDKLILPRNVHRSAISGLILSGAMPVFVSPVYDDGWQLAIGVTPTAIAAALTEHPDAKAVLIVSPTYQGICADVGAISAITHRYSLPLIVDEAHGPHFAFHADLPMPALQAGADVVIQSTHKVLSALTQASMLHVQGGRCDRNRLLQALQMVQSTSPSYLLLASLDAARHQMANHGSVLMARTLALAEQARQELNQLLPLRTLQQADLSEEFRLDLTRLTLDCSTLGITGFDADELLNEQFSVTAELPTLNLLTFIVSLGNTANDIEQLGDAVKELVQNLVDPLRTSLKSKIPSTSSGQATRYPLPTPHSSLPTFSPRQAFFTSSQACPLADATGQISAETVCAYPPGIPTLMPGEAITETAIAQLQMLQQAGATFTGNSDVSLKTLRVVQPHLPTFPPH
ncbi:MAG: aminotransferase class I/II-fold pyridoxal phosphate-dependent enzyme [Cyanobacteria bacterium P01_G01_bin.38]